MSPRLHENELDHRTPAPIGPGSYIDKKHNRSLSTVQGGASPGIAHGEASPLKFQQHNLQFGTIDRFKMDQKKIAIPGPGMYND